MKKKKSVSCAESHDILRRLATLGNILLVGRAPVEKWNRCYSTADGGGIGRSCQ